MIANARMYSVSPEVAALWGRLLAAIIEKAGVRVSLIDHPEPKPMEALWRGVPAWLRFAVVFPPLGLWFPYPLYRKSHSTHHRDAHLTVPGVDTESYYVLRADWDRMGPVKRALLTFNQTMAGRGKGFAHPRGEVLAINPAARTLRRSSGDATWHLR
jgi:hypothetical protein